MSDKTNLADLLALNLHKFEDEVRNIVDKATKELSMEKTLKVSNKSRDIICGKIYSLHSTMYRHSYTNY